MLLLLGKAESRVVLKIGLTERLQKKITIRDKLFKKFKKTKLNVDKEIYTKSRNVVRNLIKIKKQKYFEDKLNENIGKPKELWKTLKSLGLPTKTSAQSNICLENDNKLLFDSTSIAETFKTFFANLASNLVKKFPSPKGFFGKTFVSEFYKNIVSENNNFNLHYTSNEEVIKIIKKIEPSKAAGIDNLSGKFLKDGAEILATPISQICNLSIKSSSFPNSCKIAKLKPLFKKGVKTEPKNYRPISLLPLISKVIEKIIHDQTQEFLSKNNILYKFQSGFRKNHSTDSCLSFLNDKILKGFDSGLLTGMILIDLQKAFDTIDHEILLEKLPCMGFSDKTTGGGLDPIFLTEPFK